MNFAVEYFYLYWFIPGQNIKYRPDILTANQPLLIHYFIIRLVRICCSLMRCFTLLR